MDNKYFEREKPQILKKNITIFINQAGYFPSQPKKAILTVPSKSFNIVSEDGSICYTGKTTHFGLDKDSDDDVYVADFSDFVLCGKYRIVAENGNKSKLFEIGEKCYDKVFSDMTKALYYLRCGCALEKANAGKFTHSICHNLPARLWEDKSVSIDVNGGWHDAGDYGRYVTAGACAVAHLLYGFRMFPKAFGKLRLNIPDSSESVPDVLTECRYELEWLLKMQRSDGAVYHKATTEKHAAFIMPEDDKEQMYVFAVSSMATADLAAICAMSSDIYEKYDRQFSQKLFKAAEKAYSWLTDNPEFIGFDNPPQCNTGVYGESDDADNRFWAETEMFCLTGDEKYHQKMKELIKLKFPLSALGYAQTGGFAGLSYIMSNRENKDKNIETVLKNVFIYESEKLRTIADQCGYGTAMRTEDYCWGSNMNLLRHAMTFIISDYITGKNTYSSYTCAQFDYLLGLNATGYSYVTGNGELCCNNPHLRPTYADGIDECIPGMVSGGANRFPCDEDAKILLPKGTPPMKCYVDDVGCYSLNEITIYWNSPAVFTAAYLITTFSDDEE